MSSDTIYEFIELLSGFVSILESDFLSFLAFRFGFLMVFSHLLKSTFFLRYLSIEATGSTFTSEYDISTSTLSSFTSFSFLNSVRFALPLVTLHVWLKRPLLYLILILLSGRPVTDETASSASTLSSVSVQFTTLNLTMLSIPSSPSIRFESHFTSLTSRIVCSSFINMLLP